MTTINIKNTIKCTEIKSFYSIPNGIIFKGSVELVSGYFQAFITDKYFLKIDEGIILLKDCGDYSDYAYFPSSDVIHIKDYQEISAEINLTV